MADEIRHDDLFQDGALKGIKKDALETKKAFQELEKALISLLGTSAKLAEQNKAPKNIKEIKALSKAISDVDKQDKALIATRKEMQKLDKQIEKDRLAEIRLAKAREKAFDDFEKQQQKNIRTAQKAKKATLDNANAFKKLEKRTNTAQARFKRLAAQYGATSKIAEQARRRFEKLDDELRQINNTARDGRRDVGRYGLAFQKVGGVLSRGLGVLGITAGIAGLARVMSSTIGVFSGFEKANSNLQAISGATSDEMRLLKESAKELGATTAFTASQVTELQTEFAKLGFSTREIEDATESTLALAAAAGIELAEAAAVAGATLGGFGLGAEETARVADVMAKSFSISALDMEKFKESMKSAAPAAKAVGVSVEKTTALLGTLANAGISGSKAGNNLKTTFINLNKEGLTLQQGLEKVANSEDKLGTAAKLVGKNAAASFLVLADGVEVTENLEDGLLNAAGAAQEMADVQLDNLAGDVTILGSAWEGFILSVENGEGALSNFLRQSVQMATAILGVLTGTKDLSDEFFEMKEATDNLESSVSPLLDRYDELAEKTVLTADEQEELDEIILKVADDIPTAISAFDEYGKAMGLSTVAAREFIEQQKALLVVKNAEAIEEQEGNLVSLRQQLDLVNFQYKIQDGVLVKYNKTLDDATNGARKFTAATEEEVLAYQDRLKFLQTNINGTIALIAELKGEKTAAEEAADAERELNKELASEEKEEENKIITDLIEKKQAEIKARQEVAATSKAALIVKNQELEKLGEELKILRELGIEKEKEIELAKEREGISDSVVNQTDQTLQARRQLEIQAKRILLDRRKRILKTAEFEAKSEEEQLAIKKKFLAEEDALIAEEVAAKKRAIRDDAAFRLIEKQAILDSTLFAIEAEKEKQLALAELIEDPQERADRIEQINSKARRDENNEIQKFNSEVALLEAEKDNKLFALNLELSKRKDALREKELALDKAANEKRLADEKAANDKRREENLKLFNEISRATQDAISERNKENIKLIDAEIKRAEAAVAKQTEIAEKGQENILAEEQARLAKANLAKQREAERAAKQEQNIALATAFLNNLAARSKTDPETAFALALRDTLGAKLIAEGLASFYDGTEDTGTTSKPLDSKGGRTVVVHDNERIMTKAQNNKTGGMSNDALADLAYNYQHGNLDLSPSHFKQLEVGRMMQPQANNMQPVIAHLQQQTDRLEKAFKDGQTDIRIDWNKHGEVVETREKKRVRRAVTFKRSRLG